MNNPPRLVNLKPPELSGVDLLADKYRDLLPLTFPRRFTNLPAITAIVDGNGLPLRLPTLFLCRMAVLSSGLTSDTQRTYGECLLAWLRYLQLTNTSFEDVTEETLQLYRAQLFHGFVDGRKKLATATVSLRLAVIVQFYRWCQNNGLSTSLGKYLHSRVPGDRSLTARRVHRHPQILSLEEIVRLMRLAQPLYRLAFRWALVTGLRRFEVSALKIPQLPIPQRIPFAEDGLIKMQFNRKGGKETTVYAPSTLVEETHWYTITDRAKPKAGYEEFVFIGRHGLPISRHALSQEFRRCAQIIGSSATLHHLRHTYAVAVLKHLEDSTQNRETHNNIKTLQVLMGHSQMETTEIYLRASPMATKDIIGALEYLYGATI